MGSCRTWRLHIGAHKTATTHLQDTLAKHKKILEAVGAQYLSREEIRQENIKIREKSMALRFGLGDIYLRKFANKIHQKSMYSSTMIISEENFCGSVAEIAEPVMYPRLERRLGFLSSALQGHDIKYFLSIRNQVDIIPSSYVHTIKYKPMPHGFEPIRSRVMADPPRWSDLVYRLKNTIGWDVPLSIWLFETYLRKEQEIISLLCGNEINIEKSLDRPDSTRTPSWEAVREIEMLGKLVSRSKYRKEVKAIIETDNGNKKYTPFNAQEINFLESVYEIDIERIAQMYQDSHVDSECFFVG